MKKIQYISPACKVININVESRFLTFSQQGAGGDIGHKPETGDGGEWDVKEETNFWDEW